MTFDQFMVRDFLEHPAFNQWVLAPDAQADAFWQQFLADHPEKRSDVLQAKALILAVKTTPQHFPTAEEKDAMWQYVQERTQTKIRRLPVGNGWVRWAAAAAVVLLLGIGWRLYRVVPQPKPLVYTQLIKQANRPLTEQINTTSQPRLISLSDGSQVRLNPASRVSYPSVFGKTRDVYLEGEAFFQVQKNPKKPFFVYAGNIVTRVVGTSFTVRAFANDPEVKVTVRTGVVSVSPTVRATSGKIARKSVLLVANQQVNYRPESEKLVRTLAEQPVALPTEIQREYTYTDQPVADVLSDLEKRYGIPISYDRETTRNCVVTMSFANESFYECLTLVCLTIGATYEVIDAQIVLKTKTC